MRVELHPEARAELRAAALWYDERRSGLGDELVAEIATILDRIGEGPASFTVWSGTPPTRSAIRKAVLDQFPYVLAFEGHPDHVLVLAVAHSKRRPLYWLSRSG